MILSLVRRVVTLLHESLLRRTKEPTVINEVSGEGVGEPGQEVELHDQAREGGERVDPAGDLSPPHPPIVSRVKGVVVDQVPAGRWRSVIVVLRAGLIVEPPPDIVLHLPLPDPVAGVHGRVSRVGVAGRDGQSRGVRLLNLLAWAGRAVSSLGNLIRHNYHGGEAKDHGGVELDRHVGAAGEE